MTNSFMSNKYAAAIIIDNTKMSTKLYSNFPNNTELEFTCNRSSNAVPLSSSATNVLDSPDIALKKITIHNVPERISMAGDSFPMENNIMERVVTTNISNAFKAYRVRNSETNSFIKT